MASDSSTFRVYVAAASTPQTIARVRAAIAMLRAAGIEVTSTWLDRVAEAGDPNPRDVDDSVRRESSVGCLNEIDAADAVWFLVPTRPETTCGGWYEAGYAYSERKHIVSSGDTKQSIFGALGHEFATDGAAVLHLRDLAERARIEAGLRELAANAPATVIAGSCDHCPPGYFGVLHHVACKREVATADGSSDEVTPLPPAPSIPRTRAMDFDLSDEERGRGR